MKEKREKETISEYDHRINYQQSLRAKDNKSKLRRMNKLVYLSEWHKASQRKESRNEKYQRIHEHRVS